MTQSPLMIGWAEGDVTPEQPVVLRGLFHARLSEEVLDPLTVTAWALESGDEHVVFVSLDLISVSDALRDQIRRRLAEKASVPDPHQVIINATHTHTGPEIHVDFGIDLGEMKIADYIEFAAERIAETVVRAWRSRKPGSVAYGLDYAVIGRNRRWINDKGEAKMLGLTREVADTFRHIEGFEEHSVNIAATYDEAGTLTGLVINAPSTAQLSESRFVVSADWWHETRKVLREMYGEKLFILPQCSAAGEITPFPCFEKEANRRMLELKGRTDREEVAVRLARAVQEVVPYIAGTADSAPLLRHSAATLDVPANRVTKEQAEAFGRDAAYWERVYHEEREKLERDPSLKSNPRWYVDVTNAHRRMMWNKRVVMRYETQGERPTLPAEIHVVRLGDIVFATVPYEYYLDFGIQIKVRSVAVQTFIVQLAGAGTYVPSFRSVKGGGYGSVPASNPVGPEGGQFVAEHIVKTIKELFPEKV